uniref:Uncharacterized protein n=1 Tax=Aquila chrysaetos chrysaetos TaxID=223781 RepID=A0A663FER7_AQUCH
MLRFLLEKCMFYKAISCAFQSTEFVDKCIEIVGTLLGFDDFVKSQLSVTWI